MSRLSLCASIILCLHFAVAASLADEPSPGADLSSQLRKIPTVASVVNTPINSKPKQIIIHLLNWHFVSRDDFATDLSDSSDGKLSEADIERQYFEFLDDVEAIQKEQKQILRYLIKNCEVRSVYLEGLTEKNLKALNSFVKTLREFEVPEGNGAIDLFLKEQYRRDLMQLGVPTQLMITNELKSVIPLENSAAFKSANPNAENGKIQVDEKVEEKREDEMLKILRKGQGINVIVLGGGHDLTDNLERMKLDSVLYIRVTSSHYKKVTAN
tara:strand:- start:14629 stop:15438 length:810 start_codon:yes stop_codon:yes gene_type:complete